MIRVHRRPLRLVAAVLTVGVLGAACGSPSSSSKGEVAEPTTTTIARGPETTAAQLRARLAGLLGEHVYLTAATAGAIAGGRGDEVSGASAAVAANSKAITANIEAIFGATAGETFGPLWKRHVDLVAAHAQGSGSAANDLAQYARDFGAFINSVAPSLPADAVAASVGMHEQGLRAVIDAQRAGNETQAFTALRAAAAHMNTVAATLTGGIAKTLPDKIGGDPASKAAELLAGLNVTLREHVFLAGAATNAALGGRTPAFTAATGALDANTDALVAAIGSVYGPEGANAFSPLWKKHIGFLVDYTNAVRDKNQAKADEAMQNLLQYTEDFGAFINTASPKLTKDAVANLVKTHVLTLKDVIDAQAAKRWVEAYALERTAADHMTVIATGLATTIVAQFPQNF
jgi:hypothetical protein